MKPALILATISVLVLTLIPAIKDGQRRFRWGEDSEVTLLASRLETFPKQIGDWRCISDELLGKTSANQLQPLGFINRSYVNDALKMQTNVFILLGPTGPTAVHTPDICFSSREFTIINKRKVVSVDPDRSSRSMCFETNFKSRDVSGSYLTSWYAWTIDGDWQAPENARYYFAGSRFLFKIQITARYPDLDTMENDKVMRQFLAEIEQNLRSSVF